MPDKNEFSAKEKELILEQAQSFWDTASGAYAPFYNLIDDLERLATGRLPAALESKYEEFEDRACLVPPDIFNNLNSLCAHVRHAVFSKRPFFRASVVGQPGLQDDRIEKAEQKLQAIMDQENDGRGFVAEADKAIYQALAFGLSVVITSIVRKTQKVPVRQDGGMGRPDTDIETGRTRYAFETVSILPETKALDIRRCRIDPSAAERSDIRIVGYHSLSQLSDLIAKNRNPGSHYSFDEKALKESTFDRQKYFEYVDSETLKEDSTDKQYDFGDQVVETQSIKGLFRFPRPDGGYDVKDLHVEIGNRIVLLAARENDLPLASYELFDFPAVDEMLGRILTMGVVEPARDVFIESFIKLNQSIDAANRRVHGLYIGDSSACQNLPQTIEHSANTILKVDTGASGLTSVREALAPLEQPIVGQDTFQQHLMLVRSVQQTMRESDYLQGRDPGRTETATGVVELVSGGEELTGHLIEKLTDTFFRPVARKKLILWSYLNGHTKDRIYSRSGKALDIAPGELNNVHLFTVETNLAATNPGMVRRVVETYPIISNDPMFDPFEVRRTLVDVLDLPNRERLLTDRDYLQHKVDVESAAMCLGGIPVEPHELDNHSVHIELHAQYLQYMSQDPPEGFQPELLEEHIQKHQQLFAQESDALGNTRDLGGGAAEAGNLVQPDAAARKGLPTGVTGAHQPSEGRA